MLKSCGCDAMTGAGGSRESRERNGLGKSDPDRCTPLGKSGRNMEVRAGMGERDYKLRPSTLSRTACSSPRSGGRSSAARRAT